MPWMSIITWLLTFLLSKSKGLSTAESAMLATGAGLATYYLVDPANKDNVLGVSFGGDKDVPGSVNESVPGNVQDTSSLGSFGKTVISETGSTLRSWGPTGTLGVVAGTAAVGSVKSEWWPWIIGGAVLILLK